MRRLSVFALLLAVLSCIGCNEIIGAGRYDVADGSTSADAAMDGASTDSGPFDAGDCDPADVETYYLDEDGDTYGLDDTTLDACSLPEGYAAQGGDCDDGVGTAYPGAPETCDDVDSDCDGTVDEGLIGPIDPPFEIVAAADAGTTEQTAVAAYGGGYLAISGRAARWLDETATPSSAVFMHETTGVVDNGDRMDAIVYEGTTPPRAVIASYSRGRMWLNARVFSMNETSTALSSITALRPPTDPPGYVQMRELDVVPMGDQVVIAAAFSSGGNESLLRVAAINPATWTQVGSFDEIFVSAYHGAVPLDTAPPSAVLSVAMFNSAAYNAELHWLRAPTTGPVIDTMSVLTLGTRTTIHVPAAPAGVAEGSETIMVVDDTTFCSHRVSLPAVGDPVTLPTCAVAVTWEPIEMHVRQGVIAVLNAAGGYQEEALAPGTTGAPHIALGIPGTGPRMAVRGNRGLVVFTVAGALHGQRLGCAMP